MNSLIIEASDFGSSFRGLRAGGIVRVVDIPDWFVWVALGMIVLQLLGLVPVTRRMRGPDPAMRSKARLDLLETIGCLLLFGGLLLSFLVTESLFWLTPVGFVLMTATYVVKGVRLLRTRRSTAQPENTPQAAHESRSTGP